MRIFVCDAQKNDQFRASRGISFDEIVFHIGQGDLLDILEQEHPNQEKYGGQRIFVVRIGDYVYLVPFAETSHEVILKTIIPSRKATKRYPHAEDQHGKA